MGSYTFYSAPKIVCENGSISTQLGNVCKLLNTKKALIVTDIGIVNCGFVDKAISSLDESKIESIVFDKVIADPPYSIIKEAISLAKKENVDLIIGLGGGSSIDTAKIVAIGASENGDLLDALEKTDKIFNKLPLIAIPTTAGTGSEVTFVSVITLDDGSKKAIYSEKIMPDVALLDAELTTGMPSHITAATALDAIVHTIEAYTSKTKKNPISDALAIKGLKLLFQNFNLVMNNNNDLKARQNMLLGSTLAGMAFVNSSVAAIHGLSYPLSINFHIPHGHSNTLVMLPVLRRNISLEPKLYYELSRELFPNRSFKSVKEAADYLLFSLEKLVISSKLETKLSSFGIEDKDISKMANQVIDLYSRLIANNPIDFSLKDIEQIYKEIM